MTAVEPVDAVEMFDCRKCGPQPADRFYVHTDGYRRRTCKTCRNTAKKNQAQARRLKLVASPPPLPLVFDETDHALAAAILLFHEQQRRTEPWKLRAACLGDGHAEFFPGRGDYKQGHYDNKCGICPVAAECLEYAERKMIRHGIWGGLGEKARRKARGWG